MNIVAELGPRVLKTKFMPDMASVEWTACCDKKYCSTLVSTASVRCFDAPSGSCTTVMK